MTELDDFPPFLKQFYRNIEVVTKSEIEAKLKAACIKCRKCIQCSWKPTRVTSNLISHTKVYLSSIAIVVRNPKF